MAASMWSVSQIHCRWFIKVRESIKILFLYQANLHDTEVRTFVARNEKKKCPCFYLDREWPTVALRLLYDFLLLFCRPVFRHLFFHRILQGLTYERSAKNDCIERGLLNKLIKCLNSQLPPTNTSSVYTEVKIWFTRVSHSPLKSKLLGLVVALKRGS